MLRRVLNSFNLQLDDRIPSICVMLSSICSALTDLVILFFCFMTSLLAHICS